MMSSGGYFPKCRKDAQCKCSMCVDSLNATRDLRPATSRCRKQGMLAALGRALGSPIPSVSSGRGPRSFFFSSPLSGNSSISPQFLEPAFEEIAADASSKKRDLELSSPGRRRWILWTMVLAIAAIVAGQFVVPVVLERQCRGDLSIQVANQSRARIKTVDRIEFIQRKIHGALRGKKVSSYCTGNASKWTLLEEGALIHSKCRLYSSMAEEVSIWGYPLVTAGVLGRRPSERFMFVLAGRVIEWKEGQLEHVIHGEGELWTHPAWAASVIHLDKNTWIVEYNRRSFDASSLLSHSWYMAKRFLRSAFDITHHFTLSSPVPT